MCLERQPQVRLAAKFYVPYPSDLSPQTPQHLEFLWVSQEPPVMLSPRQCLVSGPTRRVEALMYKGWTDSTKYLLCAGSEGCWEYLQGGIYFLYWWTIREGDASSVLGLKYKEKPDRAHISLLESFCFTFATLFLLFFRQSWTVLIVGVNMQQSVLLQCAPTSGAALLSCRRTAFPWLQIMA